MTERCSFPPASDDKTYRIHICITPIDVIMMPWTHTDMPLRKWDKAVFFCKKWDKREFEARQSLELGMAVELD